MSILLQVMAMAAYLAPDAAASTEDWALALPARHRSPHGSNRPRLSVLHPRSASRCAHCASWLEPAARHAPAPSLPPASLHPGFALSASPVPASRPESLPDPSGSPRTAAPVTISSRQPRSYSTPNETMAAASSRAYKNKKEDFPERMVSTPSEKSFPRSALLHLYSPIQL